MPYNPPDKRRGTKGQLVGYHDGQPISRRYEMKVSGNRERLKKNQTPAERAFQQIAEDIRQCYEVPFGGQRIFHITEGVAFIADFYFKRFHLAVEVDGGGHLRSKERQRDAWRSSLLKEKAGVTVIRFTNSQVLNESDMVREKVIEALLTAEKATPSYQKRLRVLYERERHSSYSDFDMALDRD